MQTTGWKLSKNRKNTTPQTTSAIWRIFVVMHNNELDTYCFQRRFFCSLYSSFGVYILMENISNDSWQLVASAFSVSPCSTLPTLINLCCFAHPANDVHGIAVDYPLSCLFWNNAIAHSHFSNPFWFICRLIILYSSNGLRSGFTDVIAHIFPTK